MNVDYSARAATACCNGKFRDMLGTHGEAAWARGSCGDGCGAGRDGGPLAAMPPGRHRKQRLIDLTQHPVG